MKQKPANRIAEDAIFCALVLALLLVLAPLFGAAVSFFGMAVTALFACVNRGKGRWRLFGISAVLLVLLAVFSTPYLLLSQYIWAIAAGLICCRLLGLERRRYYPRAFLWLLALQLGKTAFTLTVLTPMSVSEYLAVYSQQLQQMSGGSVGFTLTLSTALLLAAVKAAMQCIIIDRFSTLYRRFILREKKTSP